MRLKQAAFIIGSMGGRPAINVDKLGDELIWSYRGGGSAGPEYPYVTEDDLDFYVTEDDFDYYVWF